MERPSEDPNAATNRRGVVQLFAFVGTFLVWLPIYLICVRPVLIRAIGATIGQWLPGMLHLVPIFGVPYLVLLIAERIFLKRTDQ